MHLGGRLTPEEFWARFDGRQDQIRAETDVLPCYGLADWSGWLMLGDWSRRDGELTSVGLGHGRGEFDDDLPRVYVLAGTESPEDVIVNRRLNAALPNPPNGDDVLAAMRHATTAPIGTVIIPVGGRPEEFDHWVDGPNWFAARRHEDRTLAVEARHIAPGELSIVRVHDIEPYLAGSRATLRHLRGED